MERDEFIIWLYLWVCEQVDEMRQQWPGQRARRGGFEPALSDEEALTIELCGEMLRLRSDKAIVFYFRTHYQSWFPHLKDRTAFARQVAHLWRVKLALLQRLLRSHHAHEQWIQPIDTMPLPVCAKVRASCDQVCYGVAHKGFCAAKDSYFYGFKLGLRITEAGLITHHLLLEANPNDTQHLLALTERPLEGTSSGPFQGLVPVDKGFFHPALWRDLFQRGAHIVGHGPRHIEHTRPPEVRLSDWLERFCALLRKKVEVVASLLVTRFGVDRIRVRDQWHFEHRLLRKILAYNLLVSCNLRLKRTPLDFDGLLHD